MNISRDLNRAQAIAVYHYKGPLLVLAGPGSGKTRVITFRVAYLIREHQVPPESILAVTFTNKAAQEMINRLHSDELLGQTIGTEVWIHTFHATCVRILRKYGKQVGMNVSFAIIDEEDQRSLLSEIIREVLPNVPDNYAWLFKNVISDAKVRLKDPSQLTESEKLNKIKFYHQQDEDLVNIDIKDVSAVAKVYQEYLRDHNAMDFDDLIVTTVDLLSKNEDIRYDLQNRIRFIMVDEYQDINTSQYELLKQLCNSERNIMVVADDDQSIYSWRGSDPSFIDRFKEEYRPRVVQLVDHFRSTKNILQAAQSLIARNTRRKKGTLTTTNERGSVLHYYKLNDEDEEVRVVLWLIRALLKKRHYSPGQIAIFYRTHKLADRLEQELLKHNLPVKRIRQESFIKEAGISSIIAHMRFVRYKLEPDLHKAVNFPDILFDELTKLQILRESRRRGISFYQMLKDIDSYEAIGALTRHRVRDFVVLMEQLDDISSKNINSRESVRQMIDALEAERSPYHGPDISAIKDPDSIGNLWTAVNAIYSVLQQGGQIHIMAEYGIDNYCAAGIILYVLQDYFRINGRVFCHFLGAEREDRLDNIRKIMPKDREDMFSFPSLDVPKDLYIIIGSTNDIPDEIVANSIIIGRATGRQCISQLLPGEGDVVATSALKLCQRLLSSDEMRNVDGVVVYDLETLTNNVKTAEIIEIGAKKVGDTSDGGFFQRLVKPKSPIPRSSSDIHGITDEDVKDEPGIETVLPEFINFIGDQIVVGHNILEFDNKVIAKFMMSCLNRAEFTNPSYDTFYVAKNLFPRENYRLDALADKFNIPYDDLRLHRALDDVILTERVFRYLRQEEITRHEKSSLKEVLPLVALGILEKNAAIEAENVAYYNAALRYIQSRKSTKVPLEIVPISNLNAVDEEEAFRFIDKMKREKPPITKDDQEWNERVSRLKNLLENFEQNTYDNSLDAFLNYASLLTSSDTLNEKEDCITMMTVHSAKGTEFPVVIMIGLEQGNFPIISGEQTEAELEEERRLFYVGMTRAMKHLYLISVKYRDDKEMTPSQFIWEIRPDLLRTISSYQLREALNKRRRQIATDR